MTSLRSYALDEAWLSFAKNGFRFTSHLFFAQMGTSYVPTVAMSNWPPPVATSDVTFCLSVFSGRVTYLTLMPYFFVKSFVRLSMTIMSPLLTVAMVIVVAFVRALPPPTNVARPSATRRPKLTARRDKRMLAPCSSCNRVQRAHASRCGFGVTGYRGSIPPPRATDNTGDRAILDRFCPFLRAVRHKMGA